MADSIGSRNQRQIQNEDALQGREWKQQEEKKTEEIIIRGKVMPKKMCGNCSLLNEEEECALKHNKKNKETKGCAAHLYKHELLPPVPRIMIFDKKKTTG